MAGFKQVFISTEVLQELKKRYPFLSPNKALKRILGLDQDYNIIKEEIEKIIIREKEEKYIPV